ncbi:MAG: hypothetical protein H6983_25460 [Ectothiorhodospiraceae bacterium]|nr:hypothetical protein [Chromatiales bacterium]MCP5157549.1 hypothetical protein [Ectothiorhodospiraceae bacterium]
MLLAIGAAARPALALGLGDLQVASALGESLQATIALNGVRAGDLSSLRVRVAPLEIYRALGIPYVGALRTLRFEVEGQGRRAVVRATSAERLREPLVQMVIEATWDGGRALREYALVLSPR